MTDKETYREFIRSRGVSLAEHGIEEYALLSRLPCEIPHSCLYPDTDHALIAATSDRPDALRCDG